MAHNMSDKINSFLGAGRTIDRLVTAGSIGDEMARMLHGGEDDKAEMEKRWSCTAVMMSDDQMYIVPATGGVQYDGEAGWRVKLFADGKLDGRGRWYSAAELASSVTDVWDGSLQLGDTKGARGRGGGALGDGVREGAGVAGEAMVAVRAGRRATPPATLTLPQTSLQPWARGVVWDSRDPQDVRPVVPAHKEPGAAWVHLASV